MTCRLCTQKVDNHSNVLLKKDNTEIVKLIQKHLEIYITVDDETNINVCSRCFKLLTEFHDFFLEIHEAQKDLSIIKNESDCFSLPVDVKIESTDEYPIKDEPFLDQDSSNHFSVESENEREDLDCDKGSEINLKIQSSNSLKREDRDKIINNFFKFQCPDCSYKVCDWQNYKQHLSKKHGEPSATITCCDIRIQLDRRILLAHAEYHTNPEKLQCKCCSKQFMTIDTKRKHEYRRKIAQQRGGKIGINLRLPCTECGKLLSSRNAFENHIQLHLSNEERDKFRVQCDLCKKYFKNKPSIFAHMRDMHLPKQESISCDQCAKVCTSKRTFYTHYRTHHAPETRVVCTDCGAEMKSDYLRKHRRLKHEHQTQTCPLCLKEFKNKVSLRNHQQRVHVEPKHSCDICGRMFKAKDKLKDHREGHFVTNRFSCDQCEYVNNDCANMMKHRKVKHPDVPALPHGTARKVFEAR